MFNYFPSCDEAPCAYSQLASGLSCVSTPLLRPRINCGMPVEHATSEAATFHNQTLDTIKILAYHTRFKFQEHFGTVLHLPVRF